MKPAAIAIMGCFALLAAAGACLAAEQSLAPYRETTPDGGYVDWFQGRAGAVGSMRMLYDPKNKVYARTLKMTSEADGRTRLLSVLGKIAIGSGVLLENRAETFESVQRLIDDLPAARTSAEKVSLYEAFMEVPLWGDGGLMQVVFPAKERSSEPEGSVTTIHASMPGRGIEDDVVPALGAESPPAAPPGQVTGLVLDATGIADLQPALLPRVIDEGGRVVYGAEAADPDRVREIGLIVYAVPVTLSAPPRAAPPRQGPNEMKVKAISAGGEGKTDFVISVSDADRVLAAAEEASFLRECRVVALMRPSQNALPTFATRPPAKKPAHPAKPPRIPKEQRQK
jgi:hypothetical protein